MARLLSFQMNRSRKMIGIANEGLRVESNISS